MNFVACCDDQTEVKFSKMFVVDKKVDIYAVDL